jgi:hypothetical protein
MISGMRCGRDTAGAAAAALTADSDASTAAWCLLRRTSASLDTCSASSAE